jgi:amino acid efflux transporter
MARVIYAAARDGGFPPALAKVDGKTGAPGRSIMALLALVMASLLAFYVLDLDIQWGFLGTSGAAILIYVIGSAAGVRLLRERGASRVLPWASLLVSLAILPFIGFPLAASLAIALVGVAYSWRRLGRKA